MESAWRVEVEGKLSRVKPKAEQIGRRHKDHHRATRHLNIEVGYSIN